MKVFAVPSVFLFALLALYGACRFSFSVVQATFAKPEEIRLIHARQTHLVNSTKALLVDGKVAEAKGQLEQALHNGIIQFYSIRRDENTPIQNGDERVPFLGETSLLQVEAGPYNLSTAAYWNWATKAGQLAGAVGIELAFLLAAAILLMAFRARSRKRNTARKPRVRILRETPDLKIVPPSSEPVLEEPETEAFECTLLRLQVGSAANGEALLTLAPMLELVREELKDVCARYAGELACINGHEFISFFRDSGDGHSALLAISAARDIRHALKSAGKEIGIHYALAHGFARLLGGSGGEKRQLLGAPLLELNRIALAAGQILVTDRTAKFAAPNVKFKVRDSLIAYSGHAPLTDILLLCQRGTCADLNGYHSDIHLMEILGSLSEGWTAEAFVGVVGRLREFQFHAASPEVRDAYKKLFRHELNGKSSLRLAALVTIAVNFFRRDTIDKELYGMFIEALGNADRRVKSNSIQLFIELYPSEEIAELKPYAKSMDNRISANVLIKRALEHFDEKVVRALYGRVRGGSVAHVASALFALGEIAQHYRKQDPAHLRARQSFLRLFEEIPYWVKHPNSMVRRQALFAAKKLADPALEEKLQKIFSEASDADLLALFATVYGWKKPKQHSRRSA